MYDYTHGKHITVFCETKFNYVIDNILTYYDTEQYENVLFYVMTGYCIDNVYTQYNKIVFYNIEHVSGYPSAYGVPFVNLINYCIDDNILVEFWDFDVINYKKIISTMPKLLPYYKFKPLRYVYYKKVENNDKKYDAIQIGGTRIHCPYRNNVLEKFNKIDIINGFSKYKDFSMINIERSKYPLNELYDEINSSKVVLNIPRMSHTGQEQVRMGQLVSMNCTIATQTWEVSYLSDFVNEVNFMSDDIFEVLKNINNQEDVAEKFKQQTESDESYKNYVNKCLDKWYDTNNSYLYTIVVAAVKGDSLKNTIKSLQENDVFNKIQIIVVNIGDDSIKTVCDEINLENVYYVQCDEKTIEHAYNVGLSSAIGKYITFCISGTVFVSSYFDNVYDEIQNDKDCNILVHGYRCDGVYYTLTFETLKIGPILSCTVIKRKIINIKFNENCNNSSIIFSGILCKYNNYTYYSVNKFNNFVAAIDANYEDDIKYISSINSSTNWIEDVQKEINGFSL